MRDLVIALLSLLMVLSNPAQSQEGHIDPNLTLSPGDAIRITVWRNPELSGEFAIGPDGSIVHPLYREINVSGLPLSSVEERIRTFLSRFETTPSFVIVPLIRIVVGGEVRQPNIITVPVGTTVVQAVALAGGPTERGEMDKVRLLRESGSRILDLRKPEGAVSHTLVRSGDQILVPRARSIMQDVVVPSSSILAGVAALTTLILQLRRQ